MIPNAYLIEWRNHVPWKTMDMVEQDLLISRAIVDIFSHAELETKLAFRGGTALHKLFLGAPRRYSEDIDLVQVSAGPIGPIFDALREVLGPWLGKPSRDMGPGVAALTYRVPAESDPERNLRLKVEINTREHFAVQGFQNLPYSVSCRWHEAECEVTTYSRAEIMGTKMRALYQRRKGRDLFDLWLGLAEGLGEPASIVDIFRQYMKHEEHSVSQTEYQANLDAKLANPSFVGDVQPLVSADLDYNIETAAQLVREELIEKL